MLRFYQSLVVLIALLLLACPDTLCASKVVAKEKSALPVGYEEAAEPAKKNPRKKKLDKPKEQEADADIPSGYEDAGKARSGRRKKVKRKNAKRQAVVSAASQPIRDAKAIAKEKKTIADNPQLQALVAQMRQQLKPFFAVELTFAKTVCQPNHEQLKKMKAQATPTLEQALRSIAIQQGGQMGFGGVWGGMQRHPKDILEQFEEVTSQIVAEIFPPESVAIYQDEQRHREEFRARAGAIALVSHLDTKLRFSKQQREALTDSVQEEWQRSWQRYLQIMVSNPQFFPPVPDKALVPHLNPVQVKQWKSMKRQDLGFHWQNLNMNQGFFRNMKQEIDWFQEPEGNAKVIGFDVEQFLGGLDIVLEKAVEGIEAADTDEEKQEK